MDKIFICSSKKKKVEIPTIGTADSEDTIWMNLSEDEILHMSCAIIDKCTK